MAQDSDRFIWRAFNGRTTSGTTAALQCGGRVNISWQFWGEDGGGSQADFGAISIQLEAQLDDDAPWVIIGSANTTVGGDIVLQAYPLAVKAIRFNCTSLTLGSAATLEVAALLN